MRQGLLEVFWPAPILLPKEKKAMSLLDGAELKEVKHTLCIYHGNCADGFAAAWAVRKWADIVERSIEFHAGVYQTSPPDVTDREVLIVDFSYKKPVLLEMTTRAKKIVVLDHHKTAEADLKDLSTANLEVVFDMNRSGAMITWNYFFPEVEPPQLLKHIQDRDLWKFDLEGTREIQAAIFSYEYDFAVWDKLVEQCQDVLGVEVLRAQGAAIERKHFKDINELLPICTRHIRIDNVVLPCANLPYTMVSDAGNILANRNPNLFGICYYDGMSGRNFSLRSVEGGRDVSEIAKQFGGGGHKHAAGFRVSFEDAKQFELETVE